jgi:hypothetical protein
VYFVNLNLIIKFQVNRKRRTWDNGRNHWPCTNTIEPVFDSVFPFVCCFFSFKGMSSNGNYSKYTSTICTTILKEVSLIYHSLKFLHLGRHIGYQMENEMMTVSFFRNTHRSFIMKILKIALKCSVSTLLSNCSQTEPLLFPDDSHIGSTRMKLLFENSL